ncbi:MAG: hypothetical protein KGD59_06685 [Candidatus Heimdallarchaeota archaeon]|nr:hypothetical protein [Candidatus Heimdallarchaeota archaeon]MBY8994220.1 hypothetical protein [Candidatus Heimdallarchaeota archaeon]
MSEYTIKIYEKGIEDKQAALGFEVTKDWIDFRQTPGDGIKKYYSAPDFDPELRLYAFKGDKLVGFITSRIIPESKTEKLRVQHDFPIVLTGFEVVSELLYEKAVDTWKAKGVKVVEARVGTNWLGTMEQAVKYDYKKKKQLFMHIQLSVDKAKPKEISDKKFVDFDPIKDREQLIELYKTNYNWSDEQAIANYESIINPQEGFIFQPVLREGEKIISRGLLQITDDLKYALFRPLRPDTKKYFDDYYSYIIDKAKSKNVKIFQFFLGGPALSELDFWKSYGFEVKGELFLYEKEI